jgi:hypothetical protein
MDLLEVQQVLIPMLLLQVETVAEGDLMKMPVVLGVLGRLGMST